MGEAIYTQSFFFANQELLLDSDMQNRIKEFQFCKTFSCSYSSNLLDTPANVVDDFFIIEEELNYCMKKEQEEKSNA